jgi:L-lactate dehydrogenase complex protein LldG
MNAREAILNRVRAARRTGRIPPVDADGHQPHASSPDRAIGVVAATPDDLLSRFLHELSALGVVHHVESSAADVRARVAGSMEGEDVFAWDAESFPYELGPLLSSAMTGRDARARQASATIGVTGCHAAIAETGSLVVLSGPGTPRAASLLPPVHLCVVRRDDLYGSMGEYFEARAQDIAASSCCTFITGPSRTADIELTLTLGVHGPGTVIVVVGP